MPRGRKPFGALCASINFWRRVKKTTIVVRPELGNCWDWTGCTIDLYGTLAWAGKRVLAHRLAYRLTYGVASLPDNMLLRHKCDRPTCVRPEHLIPGTAQQNVNDAVERGRQATGEQVKWWGEKTGKRHHSAKLDRAQVEALRAEYARGGIGQRALGKKYGVSQASVSDIIRGVSWKTPDPH